MLLPTGRMWLGAVALSGFLLSVSIPWATSPYQLAEHQVLASKQLQTAVNKFPSETYAQVIRKQFNWTTVVGSPLVKSPTTVAQDEKESVTVIAVAKVQTASASRTTVSRGNADNSEIIKHALSLQGISYVFGGTTRNGFDCSGFTQYVFAGSEISLPRTSFEQFKSGTSVNQEKLQQGDLVFFTTYAKGASHVGIYISGGNFVHASINGVKISSLNESYYNSHYVGARRVL
ncbi:MAG: C40 family peptidase [Desulfitobacteriaceae bacterium]